MVVHTVNCVVLKVTFAVIASPGKPLKSGL